jgi:hypothetical protein
MLEVFGIRAKTECSLSHEFREMKHGNVSEEFDIHAKTECSLSQ